MQMFWPSLLLTLTTVHGTPAVHGNCVGEAIEAASFIASAGMQIAVIGEAGGSPEHVEKIISALSYASHLITGAVGTCGGENSACASDFTKAAHSFTVLVQAATALRTGVNPANLVLLGDELTNTATGITDAAASCAPTGTSINTGKGHCVSKAMGASVQVAAAGMAIDDATETCVATIDGDDSKCQRERLFIVNTLALASKRSVEAAKDCERLGLLDCGIDISEASAKITEASGLGITLRGKGIVGIGPLATLTAIGDALSVAAGDLGATSYHCVRNSTTPEVHYGTCVGDAIQATQYITAASVGISVAVQDCQTKSDNGGDSQTVATCMSDLSFVITNYAKTANEILWATADCQGGQGSRVQCGSDVSMAISAIGAAAASAARLANLAIRNDITALATERDPNGNTELEVLGKELNKMSSLLGSALSTCASTPGPAQPPAGVDTEDHDAENYAAEYGGSVVQRWSWGSKAKKWLQVGSHRSKGQKHHIQTQSNVLTMGMVAIAVAAGVVFFAIKVVRRQKNAEHPEHKELMRSTECQDAEEE